MNRERQIADYDAWTDYVDPQGIVSEEQFCQMTSIEKLAIIETVFGADAVGDADGADADAAVPTAPAR